MAVDKIEAFKTSDGQVFTDKKEADKYELAIEVRAELTKIVDDELYNGLDKRTVVDFLIENKSTLFSILSKRVM